MENLLTRVGDHAYYLPSVQSFPVSRLLQVLPINPSDPILINSNDDSRFSLRMKESMEIETNRKTHGATFSSVTFLALEQDEIP